MNAHRIMLETGLALASWIASTYAIEVTAQETYLLSSEGLSQPSVAIRQQDGLVIRDAAGQETYYRRERGLDSQDGQWTGYYSRDARQALQWPQSNQGPMKIGTLDRSQQWQFRSSRMSIQPQQATAFPMPNAAATVDMNQAPIPIHLGWGESNRRQYLARVAGGGLNLVPQSAMGSQAWYIVPLPNGLARVQYVDQGTVLALGCGNQGSPLELYALANRADQLWRIKACPGIAGGYALESLQFPGQALTFQTNRLTLAPMVFSPIQQWWPTPPILPSVQPIYRSVTQNIISNPALPPSEVTFVNSHRETLIVLVADLRRDGTTQKFRIPSGASERMMMDRDSGATIIETFEIRSNFGDWDRREFRTPVPPSPIYDISVYEEFLQSIAIDATGSSPNPIEDINYQPRSIGLIPVPPGPALPQRASLDPYRLAEAANNPGAVRRLNAKDYDQKLPNTDPLGDILREIQGRRAAF